MVCPLYICTCRDKESVSFLDVGNVTLGDHISKEDFTLTGRHHPLLVTNQILLSGRDQVKHLLTL